MARSRRSSLVYEPPVRPTRLARTWVVLDAEHAAALMDHTIWAECGEAGYAQNRAARIRAILDAYDARPWRCPELDTSYAPDGQIPPRHRCPLSFDGRAMAILRSLQRGWDLSARQVVRRLIAGWLRKVGRK